MVEVLVTGGAGFIGSNFVRWAHEAHRDWRITTLDKLTYAGRRENLEGVEAELVVGAIEDRDLVMDAVEGCDAVVNFAAESHVDRSISDQEAFARTHVIGTGVLLDAVRERGDAVAEEALEQARAAGVTARAELVNDRPAEALARVAAEERAELIAVGSYGEKPLRALILGSTPYRLLHITDVPVLVVRA